MANEATRVRDPEGFWARVDRGADCWLWRGHINRNGYGIFGVVTDTPSGRGSVQAHRAAYALLKGEVPIGMHLDHLCRNRECVNPEHLEPVSLAENNRRAVPFRTTSPTLNRTASVHVAHLKSGTRWRVYFRRDGRQGSVTFLSSQDAEALAAAIRADGIDAALSRTLA